MAEAAATITAAASAVVAEAAAAAAVMGDVHEFKAKPMDEYSALAVVPKEPILGKLAMEPLTTLEGFDPRLGVLAAL